MCVTDSKYSEPNGDGVMKIAKIMANNGKKNHPKTLFKFLKKKKSINKLLGYQHGTSE